MLNQNQCLGHSCDSDRCCQYIVKSGSTVYAVCLWLSTQCFQRI